MVKIKNMTPKVQNLLAKLKTVDTFIVDGARMLSLFPNSEDNCNFVFSLTAAHDCGECFYFTESDLENSVIDDLYNNCIQTRTCDIYCYKMPGMNMKD